MTLYASGKSSEAEPRPSPPFTQDVVLVFPSPALNSVYSPGGHYIWNFPASASRVGRIAGLVPSVLDTHLLQMGVQTNVAEG